MRSLITPEGRVLLDRRRPHSTGTQAALLDLYRDWCQAPLIELADDVAGVGEKTMPLALAAIVVLLALGATSRASALILEDKHGGSLAAPLTASLQAFNDRITLRGEKSKPAGFGDYPLSKARRRMGGDLRRDPGRRWPARIWIEASARGQALDVVAAELIERRRIAPNRAITAVYSMLDVLAAAADGSGPLASRRASIEAARGDLAAHLLRGRL